MKGLKEIVMAVSVLGALAAPAFSASTKSTQQQQQQLQQTTIQQQHQLVLKRPNLIIRSVEAVPGDDRKLRAAVVNVGGLGAGPSNLKLFYVRSGKVMVVNTSVPALPSGDGVPLTVSIGSPIAYAQHVYLRADDPNAVAEMSEGDNSYIYK
jgi:hypothetical protein